jgi:hypothetical protein
LVVLVEVVASRIAVVVVVVVVVAMDVVTNSMVVEAVVDIVALDMEEKDATRIVVREEAMNADIVIVGSMDAPTDTHPAVHAMIDIVVKTVMVAGKNDEAATTAAKIVETALMISSLLERAVTPPIQEAVATTTVVMNATLVEE